MINKMIISWRNKVNKYSLCIAGKTIFNNNCPIKRPQDYLKISLSGINIEKFVKKLPTPEELKEYYVHNKDKILKDFLHQYREFENNYFKIIQKYSISDFIPLAKAKCNKCGYFIIKLDLRNL